MTPLTTRMMAARTDYAARPGQNADRLVPVHRTLPAIVPVRETAPTRNPHSPSREAPRVVHVRLSYACRRPKPFDKAVGSTLGAERPLPAKAAVYDLGHATALNVQLVHWLCPRRAIPVRVMSHPVSLHSRMDTPDRYPFGVRHRSALPLHRPVRSKALVERSPLQRPKQPACRSLHGATMVPYHSWWMDRDC
jgi:hypothetical protein